MANSPDNAGVAHLLSHPSKKLARSRQTSAAPKWRAIEASHRVIVGGPGSRSEQRPRELSDAEANALEQKLTDATAELDFALTGVPQTPEQVVFCVSPAKTLSGDNPQRIVSDKTSTQFGQWIEERYQRGEFPGLSLTKAIEQECSRYIGPKGHLFNPKSVAELARRKRPSS